MCASRRFHLAVCLMLVSLGFTRVSAQTPPPVPSGPLSLEQVLTLAEPRSEGLEIARAGQRRADGDQVRARSQLFPQLSASASYDRALASEFSRVR